ncbi:SUMF1/EgtB/PvdO family nonheme iron enzyme [Candidatus Haliotispira prima]|uniref:SUMF1/EgtB/PvdO family nonheme iron enzyme n=1 Tax=Candidatus Haliotispira prima TaxID=3034016 RepID=A0ABY8ML81_9SPIO|nr:SUMF1/EgtB/PvdO family nonheme iron enzyme [Candidatus Haliotispira prima]
MFPFSPAFFFRFASLSLSPYFLVRAVRGPYASGRSGPSSPSGPSIRSGFSKCHKNLRYSFCCSVAALPLLLFTPRLAAGGQLPESAFQNATVQPPAGADRQQPKSGIPGSGLSPNSSPVRVDPRFIIRRSVTDSITEKLDTSVKDGMVYVNSAYYIMGGSQGEYNAKTPGHRVAVPSFWISPYEVYWKLWNDVFRWSLQKGYRFARQGRARRATLLSGLDNPVHHISWFDAIVWCNAYSEVRGLEPVYRYNSTVTNYVVRSSGNRRILESLYIDYDANGYRLPKEAEWELAARGGVAGRGYLFAGSNKEVDVAWYRDNTQGRKYAHSVGILRPNELGLYDMNGNLAEWTNDWYAEDYYYSSPVDNPLGPGSGKFRVVRGGSFRSRPKEDFFTPRGKRIRKRKTWLAVEMRERMRPHWHRRWIGFRPVRNAVFRPVEYLRLPDEAAGPDDVPGAPPAAPGDGPVIPGDLGYQTNDGSPYIYSLDPAYRPDHSAYRDGREDTGVQSEENR